MLFVASWIVFTNEPGADSPGAKIRSYYADHGNQLKLQIAYFLITLGVVSFLWFVGTLAARLRQVEGEPSWLSRTVLVSGGAFTGMCLIGFTLGVMVPTTADHTSRFHVDPDTARLLNDAMYPIVFETALPLAAPLVLAASLVFLRTTSLPHWFGRAGVVVAIGCLLGFLAVPMALFLGWILVLVVYLVRRGVRIAIAPLPTEPAQRELS